VLDLGSGGGLDVLLSARRVARGGTAYGLDANPDMLTLAHANAVQAGVTNARFLHGHIEDIPLPDGQVDVVISNCVINLSADKPHVLAEAFRVLRPGGATVLTFGGAQRPMLPGPVGDLETARLASGAANVVAYIANPTAPSSGTDSYTWAEAIGPDGQTVTAELHTGEGVRATAAVAAETTRRVLAGVAPGTWTPGQLFGASLVTDATSAQVTVNGQPA